MENYGIAVKKDNKKLLDLINNRLKEVMKDGLIDQLKKIEDKESFMKKDAPQAVGNKKSIKYCRSILQLNIY